MCLMIVAWLPHDATNLSAVCDNVVFPDHTQLLFFVNSSPEKQYFKNRKMFKILEHFTIPKIFEAS